MDESVSAKAKNVSTSSLLPGASTWPQPTSKEHSQRAHVDDRLGEKACIVAVGAPGHQMEVHGERLENARSGRWKRGMTPVA